ncbi:hypothetical protein [Clostridium amazonitimonense]|uniref:hypothetical protein n=1 Tax=Clostridium amazonitimonense TaxID=1499689 RepID=UPI000509ACBE
MGKDNAINGDKIILKLKFKAKAVGTGKVDVVRARIADNGTMEKDILSENCGEKEFTVSTYEVNRDVNLLFWIWVLMYGIMDTKQKIPILINMILT